MDELLANRHLNYEGRWPFVTEIHPAILTVGGILVAAFLLMLWINHSDKK